MAARVVHLEIPAQDADRAQGFYEGLLGWQLGQVMPEQDYRMADLGEGQGAAVYPSDEGGSGMKIYFGVDDIDASLAQVRELGGSAEEKKPAPGLARLSARTGPRGNSF